MKEYNIRWKKSAENLSTVVFAQSNQTASFKRKSLHVDAMIDEPLLVSSSDPIPIPKKSKTLVEAIN